MHPANLFSMPTLDLDVVVRLRACIVHPALGTLEVVELALQGMDDEDKDGNPEFVVDLQLADRSVIPQQFRRVEIPLAMLAQGISGGAAGARRLADHVLSELAKAGFSLPS